MTFQHDGMIQFQVSVRFVTGINGELHESELRMLWEKLVEISGGKCVAADVSAAAAAIIKANDAMGVAVTSAWQPVLFLLDNLADNQ